MRYIVKDKGLRCNNDVLVTAAFAQLQLRSVLALVLDVVVDRETGC